MIFLKTPLSSILGIGPKFVSKLKKLGVETVKDLLWHFPTRYEDFSQIYKIADLIPKQQATVQGIIKKISGRRAWHRRLYIVEAFIKDSSGSIKAVWFNQPYIKNILQVGRLANFSGKVVDSDEPYLSNPIYELVNKYENWETKHTARIVPIYSETKGLTSKGLRYLIKPLLEETQKIPEVLPLEILKKQCLPEINKALKNIHFPHNLSEALLAKKRFAFEDLFLLQLSNLKQRLKLAREKAPAIDINLPELKKLIGQLPFELTPSQKKSLWEIIQDLNKPRPMNRLLQGDVGSGKTIIAAIAALRTAEAGCQTAFMAPTEILASQHYQTLIKFFPKFEKGLALLTGSEAKVYYGKGLETEMKKSELYKKISVQKIAIIIGTHALIQKTVRFPKLALVIVDEQHRFGVSQRASLIRRSTQTNTQINADYTKTQTTTENFLFKDLTYKIRGAIFEVSNKIGLGLKENIYSKALIIEFKKRNINFTTEKSISINYNNENIGTYRPDFIIDNKVILEIKALPFIGKIEEKQIWSYLKGSDYKLALLVNFGSKELNIKRIIHDKSYVNLRESGSSLRESALILPHFLSMSATPIPRTLNLTIFGDLDLSLITELPKNRKPIITKIVAPENREKAYQFIRDQIKKGRQAFVICPRIEPTQTKTDYTQTKTEIPYESVLSPRKSMLLWETKAVKTEYEKLSKKIFPDLKVAMLHGKMKPKEKEKTMSAFAKTAKEKDKNKRIDILVSTSVVEVGVDVSNATIMMTEGTERFGLAQLYQFRGRVGRGEHQSYCLLFTDSAAKTTQQRLKSIVEAKNGFELAEKDLKIRGPGEFFGEAQTGLPDLAMKALQNPELVKAAREAAREMLRSDPALEKHPLLSEQLIRFQTQIHFE